ncbi:cellulose biosynthesis cyclic di-GMP-binding regulatory protein BcsB [Pleomorphomonas sp. PLEO]|uniref:cellulose biosynthesis cyclic di-GMP-binding regulatory protein BcsB n=1 Tax=Pleomorphomonas sp. PLEO TaxID=3239306 RepID=UPI00351DEB7E
MKPSSLLLASLIALSPSTLAAQQAAPFDMSGERTTPPVVETPQAVKPAEPVAAPATGRAYLLPAGALSLEGEEVRRSWSVYLSPEQAEAGQAVSLGYQNAIAVAPEFSALTLSINGTPVGKTSLKASERPASLSFDLPAGLLKPGSNRVSIEATQRHRTDCGPASTAELWTRLDPATTFIEAKASSSGNALEAIRSIGADSQGQTTFSITAPALRGMAAVEPLLRLAGRLQLAAGMPNQSVSFSADTVAASQAGHLSVLVGTADELRPLLPGGADLGAATPAARMVRSGDASALVISGSDWRAVSVAIDGLLPRSTAAVASLPTAAFLMPEPKVITGNSRLALADLGYRTEEFSGRRLRTDLAVGLPGDFYANAYGDMVVHLDTAFTKEVLPGSGLVIFVNDQVAAAIPIDVRGGGVMRELPVRVPMRHFRPGLNIITFEANLLTEADVACAPGHTGDTATHFVLFDTTTIDFPDYARAGQRPNLSALTQIGYPFTATQEPVDLLLGEIAPGELSAAGTLLGKLSLKAGRDIAIHPVTSVSELKPEAPAIVVAAGGQIPEASLSTFDLTADLAARWSAEATGRGAPAPSGADIDAWSERLPANGVAGALERFQKWLSSYFGLSGDLFHMPSDAGLAFAPEPGTSTLVAASPTADWLLVAAPTPDALSAGVGFLAREGNWRQLGGWLASLRAADQKITVASRSTEVVLPNRFDVGNFRLIAANWLSSNILIYVGLQIFFCILLAVSMGLLIRRFGRHR